MRTFTSRMTSILVFIILGTTLNLTSQTVYTTKTGSKYHTSDCRYLHSSKIATTVSDAKANGYAACNVCKPPTSAKSSTTQTEVKSEKSTPVKTETKATPAKTTAATRCTATTKAGTRCKRTTTDPSGKCWQHK